MKLHHATLALLAVVLAAVLASCGGNGAAFTSAGDVNAAVPDGGGSLAFPAQGAGEIESPRVTSGTGSSVSLGSDFLQMINGQVDGTSLILTGPEGDGQNAYGVYRIGGLTGKTVDHLLMDSLPDVGDKYFVGVADFTEGLWSWFGPSELPEFGIDLSTSNHRFISELGNFYFVVLAQHGNTVTHNQATLFWGDEGTGGDGDAPGAPYDLFASDGAYPDGVQVEWQGGAGANHFELYRRVDGTDGWTLIASPTEHSYFDTDVTPGVHYIYKVRAVNEAGESAFSNTDSGFAGEQGGGQDDWCPSGLVASDGTTENGVHLEWNGGSGDGGHYRIFRRVDGTDGDFAYIGETNDEGYFDTSAQSGVVYDYKVQRTGEGNACFSDADSGFWGNGGGGDDFCPSDLVATDGTYTDKVRLEWNTGSAGGVFHVYRRQGDGAYVQIGETQGGDFNDTTAEPGVTYNYKVVKVSGDNECVSNDDNGYRAGGGGDEFTCPTELAASDGTFLDGVHMEWNTGTGAGHFAIYRRVDGTDGWTLVADGLTGHTYNDTTAEPGVVYIYKVVKSNETHTCDGITDSGFRGQEGGGDFCPSDLVATDGTYADKVRLEWNTGSDGGVFYVYRRQGDGEYVQIGSTSDGGYNDMTAEPGVTYNYKVVKVLNQDECASNDDNGYAGTI